MNLCKPLLAATIAAVPLLTFGQAATGPIMGAMAVQSPQDNANLIAQLVSQRVNHGLDDRHDFKLAQQHPGTEGTMISRADHTFRGVRIFGSESVVVTGPRGALISESISDRRSGLKQKDLSVVPSISATSAIEKVVRALAPGARHLQQPSAELIIYPVVADVRVASAVSKADAELNATDLEQVVTGYQLAWLVHTRMANGNTPRFHDTVVNARDGSVLGQWSMLQTVVGTGKSQYNGTVPVSTTLVGRNYRMVDPTRGVGGTFGAMAVTNANHSSSAGAVYSNSTNAWGDGLQYIPGGSTTNANGQTAAVNAMWGLMNTYDMLKNTLGWRSLDGKNTATYIVAHVSTAYDNAYYSDLCRCMYIGDGGVAFSNLGSIDVIGHEMGHGVTAATSNLTYVAESGGLNESASDIQAEVVEAYARAGGTGSVIPNAGNDWMIGREIARDGQPLRWMWKPSKDGVSPNAWSSTIKELDVHNSSGPNNRMFYFLSQGSSSAPASEYYSSYLNKAPRAMTGIGSNKAFRIWFKALTTKFTASTNYADARLKVMAAAAELYGTGSREHKAVQRAYAAINVGADIAE